MKTKLIIALSLLFALGCSGGEDEIVLHAPEFKSSVPADKAENVSPSTQLEVSFNEVVYLTDDHGITVNQESVEVEEAYTKILINSVLAKGETYTVNIPAGALVNMEGVLLAEPVQFSFQTEALVEVDLKKTLAVANPSAQAVKLFNFLLENYGKQTLSAAMANVSWNINEAEWVNQHTGKYPAIATFDYVHLDFAPANWIDYNDVSVQESWWANNGIVSAGWHWNVPLSDGASERSFYTDNNHFSAANVTKDGTWENTIANADLEEIAGYLKLLQAKNIPVIWRPLHEAAGNIYEYTDGTAWFWWGADGAEAYKALWIYMFEYFESQGLNNLIWVWTTQTGDDEFYPGDAYVDIVGRDIYNEAGVSIIASQFEAIQESYPTKMITLSECGNVALISEQWAGGAHWAYFMPWYDYERTNDPESAAFAQSSHQYANADWWTDAMSLDVTITRDEMPDLK